MNVTLLAVLVSHLVCVDSGRRGGGGARGRGRGQSSALPSKEQLDAELDAYNSKVRLSVDSGSLLEMNVICSCHTMSTEIQSSVSLLNFRGSVCILIQLQKQLVHESCQHICQLHTAMNKILHIAALLSFP